MNVLCELCLSVIIERFGSGRFCSKKCSRSFSTKDKRVEINKKVSESLKGIKSTTPFRKGYDVRRRIFTTEDRIRAVRKRRELTDKLYSSMEFRELPLAEKRRRILKDQDFKCLCGLSKWCNKKLSLELHHKDGDHKNEIRDNLEFLCPNCHSLTENFRRKKFK